MATITLRSVKGNPLTNTEIDNNFNNLNTDKIETSAIGSTVQAYDADTAKYDDTTANFTGTLQNGGSNVLVDSDIGSTVQGYDATIVVDADIGVSVQAYDADTAKYDDTTANFTGTLQNGGSNVVVDTDINSTVIGYVTPGDAGNVLTSNGSSWTSVAAAAFDSGTVMMFGQTAAPTGWTKDTTNYNNSSLRVVTGTASTGGSVDFTTAFASQTPSGTVSISSVTGSAGATTLSTPQIPSHNHSFPFKGGPGDSQQGISGTGEFQTVTTSSTGGGGSHTHPFSFSAGSGTFSGNAINLAVKYVDVIRATKD